MPPGWKRYTGRQLDRVYSVFVPRQPSTGALRRFSFVYADAARIARARRADDAVEILAHDIQHDVAERARDVGFVHAGVVIWESRAIVIPGPSSSGKTTLVAALLTAGAAYFSDEYAVFDRRGRVHPFRRPFTFRGVPPYGPPLGTDPPALGESAEVGLVLVTHYRGGARWRPRVLTPGQGVLALVKHAVAVRRQPAATLRVLSRAVREATVIKSRRGEATGVTASILRRRRNEHAATRTR